MEMERNESEKEGLGCGILRLENGNRLRTVDSRLVYFSTPYMINNIL